VWPFSRTGLTPLLAACCPSSNDTWAVSVLTMGNNRGRQVISDCSVLRRHELRQASHLRLWPLQRLGTVAYSCNASWRRKLHRSGSVSLKPRSEWVRGRYYRGNHRSNTRQPLPTVGSGQCNTWGSTQRRSGGREWFPKVFNLAKTVSDRSPDSGTNC